MSCKSALSTLASVISPFEFILSNIPNIAISINHLSYKSTFWHTKRSAV
jgi:hypothetical protein